MTGSQALTRDAFDRIRREIDIYELACEVTVTAVTIHEGDERGRKTIVLSTITREPYTFDTNAAGELLGSDYALRG
jgi:hypothetical protein